MVRRLVLLVTAVLLLFVFVATALAASGETYRGYPVTKVVINGQELKGDMPAFTVDGHALVPLRALCEVLGADVRWDASTNTVFVSSAGSGSTQNLPPAPDENTVRIGLLAPLSGDVRIFGESVKNGFQLAVEEGQRQAGNLKIEYVVADDRNDPNEGVNAAAKLIKQDKVSAIVGSVTSRVTIPVSDYVRHHKIPSITPTATNEKVTVDNGGQPKEYIFRACFIDPYQGNVAARFALENLKAKSAAVLYDFHNPYSEGMAGNFKEAFEKGGGKVTTFKAYENRDVDFSEVLARIARQNPDILYLPDYYMRVSLIGKQARQMGVKATFLGGDGWDCPDLDFATLKGGYFINHWSPDDPRPEVRDWVNRYMAEYGAQPDIMATLAYDATKMLLSAIETANSSDPAKIKETLQDLKDFPGVTGKISFDQYGNPVKPATVMQIKNGKQVFVTTVMP